VNRTRTRRDRDALIADLDGARAEADTLRAGIHAAIDDLDNGAGPRLVRDRLADLVGPPRIARELRLADAYDPPPALHLIRERTAGGAR
jgi:hypothetical protein